LKTQRLSRTEHRSVLAIIRSYAVVALVFCAFLIVLTLTVVIERLLLG
jgi:hypothetical protein